MRNFFLADSSELMGVRHISVSWAQKRLIPSFETWCTSCSWKNFFWPIRAMWWVLHSFRPAEPKTFHSYFLDIMYLEFMKNFFLTDSSELFGVRLIFASWAQKRLIPTLDIMYVEFMRNFFLADSSERMGVRLISASWVQKRFIYSLQTSCTSNSWEMFFSLIRANWWVLDTFRSPEPKNLYSFFRDMMYVLFMKKFLLADSCDVMSVRLISASWAQKRLIHTL